MTCAGRDHLQHSARAEAQMKDTADRYCSYCSRQPQNTIGSLVPVDCVVHLLADVHIKEGRNAHPAVERCLCLVQGVGILLMYIDLTLFAEAPVTVAKLKKACSQSKMAVMAKRPVKQTLMNNMCDGRWTYLSELAADRPFTGGTRRSFMPRKSIRGATTLCRCAVGDMACSLATNLLGSGSVAAFLLPIPRDSIHTQSGMSLRPAISGRLRTGFRAAAALNRSGYCPIMCPVSQPP
jgi:hypothetical protein